MPLSNKITQKGIRKLTDAQSFERGEDYYTRGLVKSLIIDDDEIVAKVSGTAKYKVVLKLSEKDIEADCNCPMGNGGYFCKHCVATALAYIDGQAIEMRTNKKAKEKAKTTQITVSDIRKYFNRKDKKELVDLLIEQVKDNDRLKSKITLDMAMHCKGNVAVDTLYKMVDKVCDSYEDYDFDFGYNYQDMIDCGDQADEVVNAIENLLKKGLCIEVMDLAEYAIEKFEAAIAFTNDYDSGLYDCIEDIAETHFKACKKAKLDSKELAERLFRLSLQEGDSFYGVYKTYSTVLDEKGNQCFQELLLEQYNKLPSLGKGNKQPYNHTRNRIVSMVEDIAKEKGDLEMLVAIKSKNLVDSWDYLRIAELYKEHKQRDKALEWAEKAVKVFGKKERYGQLAEFLASEYSFKKQNDKAMEIVWQEFVRNVDLGSYKNLKKYADKCKQWKVWKERAICYIEEEIAKQKQQRKGQWGYSRNSDHSILVQIYLWEKAPQKAWSEAKAGGCSTNLWLKLAKQREQKYPEDSVQIYQKAVEMFVGQTNNDAYKEAVSYIKIIKKLMTAMKEKDSFAQYIAQLKTNHKRKRNFMKLIEKY